MISVPILAFVLAVYFIIAVRLSRGIHNDYPLRSDLPKVSIVVPVRNEEPNIATLLDSLLALNYPPELLQIIIVNDFSEDRTREIALSYSERFQCAFEVFDCVDEPDGKLILKTRPLAQGIDHATGDVVLMTDADCVVPPDWVRSMASYFTGNVGMVCGTTLPDPQKGSTDPLTWFETLDWLFLLGSCTGMSGSGHPQALIGNNYSVSRAAYNEIGTFRGLPIGDIDDIVLLKAIDNSKKWSVVYPAYHGVMVYTRPLASLIELARQRRRWMKGTPHVGWRGRFVLGFGVLSHVTIPLWPVFLGWWFLLPFGLLAAGDGVVLTNMLHHYRLKRLLWLVPLYPLFACSYGLLLLGFLLNGKKVEWKARKF